MPDWSRSHQLLVVLFLLLLPLQAQAEIYSTYDYPSCTPLGMDYDESTGLLWIGDLGNGCQPFGKIYTFDPSTGAFQLEFAVTDIDPSGAANGIEVVGDHVYISYSGTNRIYKFNRDGTFVQIYVLSGELTSPLGVGYKDGIFYVIAGGSIHAVVENVAGHVMEPLGISYPLPPDTAGGFLDYDAACDVWLRASLGSTPVVWLLDPVDFSVIDVLPSGVERLTGVSVGPPNGGEASMYIMESVDPGDVTLIYRSNADCSWPPPDPPGEIIDTWNYPQCDPEGMDLDPATGLLWTVDQGALGPCPPVGQIFTFDQSTGMFELEFVVSDVIGDPEADAQGIEVVGDHVYITHNNPGNPGGPLDDSIYKFTRDGVLVHTYEMSSHLNGILGLGYRDGVFYAISVPDGRVYAFSENVGTGQMEPLDSYPLPPGTAGGWLDHDPVRDVWLRTTLAVPYAVWVLDARDFSEIDIYYSGVERVTGVSVAPDGAQPNGAGPAIYLTESVDSENMRLIYRANNWPTTSVESSDGVVPRRPQLRVYPNPLRAQSVIEWQGGATTASLYNPLGRLILKRDVGGSRIQWDDLIGHRNLAPGVYFLRLGQQTRRVVLMP